MVNPKKSDIVNQEKSTKESISDGTVTKKTFSTTRYKDGSIKKRLIKTECFKK